MTLLAAAIIAVLIVLHAAGIAMAIDVIMRGRTAQGTIAWALALVFLPVISLPLYFVFGDRRFDAYAAAVRHRRSGVEPIGRRLRASLEAFAVPDDELSPRRRALAALARYPVLRGNAVTLLCEGNATFDAIVAAIEGASSYVLVQFYIIRDDGIGRRLREALEAASRRGVRVHLLYDEIGSYSLPHAYLQSLTDAGCACSGFRAKPRPQEHFRLNFRNHRKTVVVDGTVAFTGGFNVGDEYMGLDPALRPWCDTHVEIRGPAVLCAQMIYLEDWFWATNTIPELNWEPRAAADPGVEALVVPTGPADDLETCRLLFSQLVNAANRRVWLATPYFVPDDQFVSSIQLAALRGADVRVLIPHRADRWMPWLSAFSYYEECMIAGVRLFRHQRGFIHRKVMLCDELACVSSANLDDRSFRINFEISVVVRDASFAKQVEQLLEGDFRDATAARCEEFTHASWTFRFLCRLMRLFAPIQ